MEKTRVKKGEKYWYVDDLLWVRKEYETDCYVDRERFINGNYFPTRKQAMTMALKLLAVLKGADVIEMPSEEEIKERLNMIIPTQLVEPWCVEGYCKHIIGFVKSKIVK